MDINAPDLQASLENAAHDGAFGINRRPAPTDAQCAAGNYKVGRVDFHGLPLAIEQPRGTYRTGTGADGKRWSTRLAAHYGYVTGTKGADGDPVDCFIGQFPMAELAYVINQQRNEKADLDQWFDEHKIMLGFPDEATARQAYLNSYERGWKGLSSIVPATLQQLKWWLKNGDLSRPLRPEHIPSFIPQAYTAMTQKTWWTPDATPENSSLGQVLYDLRRGEEGCLVMDAVTLADIIEDSDGGIVLDALVTPYSQLQRKMDILKGVMDRAGGAVKVAAMQISEPFTQKGTANVAVIFELSDGQTVSVYLHNPDTTPKKIAPADELISWKWLLNKKDITLVVAPERGEDLHVREVARRIMKLAEKNSPAFQRANANRAAKMQAIEGLRTEITQLEGELAGKQRELEAKKVENEMATPKPVQAESIGMVYVLTAAKEFINRYMGGNKLATLVITRNADTGKIISESLVNTPSKEAITTAINRGHTKAGDLGVNAETALVSASSLGNLAAADLLRKRGIHVSEEDPPGLVPDGIVKGELYDVVINTSSGIENPPRFWKGSEYMGLRDDGSVGLKQDLLAYFLHVASSTSLKLKLETLREYWQKGLVKPAKMEADTAPEFDPTTPEGYAEAMADPALQEKWQDRLDAFFQTRILAVRQALRDIGWDGRTPVDARLYKDSGGEIQPTFTHVGAGKNVVGYMMHGIADDLTQTPAEFAARVDATAVAETTQAKTPSANSEDPQKSADRALFQAVIDGDVSAVAPGLAEGLLDEGLDPLLEDAYNRNADDPGMAALFEQAIMVLQEKRLAAFDSIGLAPVGGNDAEGTLADELGEEWLGDGDWQDEEQERAEAADRIRAEREREQQDAALDSIVLDGANDMHWITTKTGSHLLIQGNPRKGFTVRGGAGGKFNGQKWKPMKIGKAVKGKEYHEMTREEFHQSHANRPVKREAHPVTGEMYNRKDSLDVQHRRHLQKAAQAGKMIPEHVQNDFKRVDPKHAAWALDGVSL